MPSNIISKRKQVFVLLWFLWAKLDLIGTSFEELISSPYKNTHVHISDCPIMHPISSQGSEVPGAGSDKQGTEAYWGRPFLHSVGGYISMTPFHSKTQKATESLQKFWAKGDTIFYSAILERSVKGFEREKVFSAHERIGGVLIYHKTRVENYYSKWNLIWQKQPKKIVLTRFVTAIKVSKTRTSFMTSIFNDEQTKASALGLLERISVKMTPHLTVLCGMPHYRSVHDQTLQDVWSAYIYSNQQLRRVLRYN